MHSTIIEFIDRSIENLFIDCLCNDILWEVDL